MVQTEAIRRISLAFLEAVRIFSIFSKPRTWMYEAGGH